MGTSGPLTIRGYHQARRVHGNNCLVGQFVCVGQPLRTTLHFMKLMSRAWNFRQPIAVGLVFLISLIGMATFNEDYKNERLFDLFIAIFWLAVAYIVLVWVIKQLRHYRQMKNESARAELALLKSKIDPHFFFNTLNNLYGLVVEKSEQAPEVILKLSDIMRHTIYEGEKERVPLGDEIAYLQKYIEIHEIRYHKKIEINFDKVADKDDYQIAPLLLIILVENAFKHGVESLTNDAILKIQLMAKANSLYFSVENNFDDRIDHQPGIGLKNLRRRLELLYPNKHLLQLQQDGGQFKATLEIDLK